MRSTGIRELKNNLSQYVRQVEAGERIAVTAHGRVVAELAPPAVAKGRARRNRFADLIASGIVRPPLEAGSPIEDWPKLRLARGTAAHLIELDRGEA